jgi:hypothetical protein
MTEPSLIARCTLSEQCLPDAPYRAMLRKLHKDMLNEIARLKAAQRQWVGLTDEDKLTVRRMPWETLGDLMDNTEAKLKEKNT